MPEALLTFDRAAPEQLGEPVVYSRDRWAGEWVAKGYCYPEDTAWSVSPVMPTAVLVWNYGRLRQADAKTPPAIVDKLDWQPGRYVKIEMPCDLDVDASEAAGSPVFRNRYWHGIVEQVIDEQQGAFLRKWRTATGADAEEWVATGTQRLICLGLEELLARQRIRTSSFDRGGGITGNDSTIPFNGFGGRGNRGMVDYDGSYVFYHDLNGGAANVTSWSTREIVRYLLRRQSPRDSLNAPAIVFRVHADSLSRLPDWDLPFLDQDNATTLALINRLVTRQRLLTWWLEVADDNAVEMHVESIVPNAVQLTIHPDAKIEPATNLIRLAYDQDQATRGHVRDSELQLYDMVIARGGRLLSVATFSLLDGTIEKAWTPAQQQRYEYGANATPGFSAANLAEKQRRNAAARSDPRLDDVFSRFTIPFDWNQKCGSGRDAPLYDVFPGGAGPVPIYYPSMLLEPGLPLFPGVDYSVDRVRDGSAVASEPKNEVDRLPIQSYWKRPSMDADGVRRWMRGDEVSRLSRVEGVNKEDAERISVQVHVVQKSHSVVFRTGNGTQHSIAYGEFTPQAEDEKAGQWTYANGEALVTLALEWGLKVEGQWPDIKPFGKDTVRYLVIEAGEHYERVFVVPGTVVGIDNDGRLVRSNGGWLERPTNVVTRLNDLAHMAQAWYSIPHKIVSVETTRLLSAGSINIGDLVTRVGDPAIPDNPHELVVNASVSEIRITWEQSNDSDAPQGPTMTINTFAGELDALAVGPAEFAGAGNPFRARRTIKL